jgi:predicted Ser/Thr protein kinase
MGKVQIDRFLALAVRHGLISRAQLEAALRDLGLRACQERDKVVNHLLKSGALTPAKIAELDKLLKRRDLWCQQCHSVIAVEHYTPEKDYLCDLCGGAMKRPDGLDAKTQLHIEQVFREIGPDAPVERSGKFGRYRILRKIGRGAMGVVYLATDDKAGRFVAIKIVPDDLADDEDLLRRYQREARALTKVQHPNVVQILDVGEERGRHFIVMEYIDGSTMDQLVRAAGCLAPRPAAKLILEAATGLHHAHTCGVIHRDVKPGNILVTRGGTAKLSDFGLARGASDGTTTITLSGLVLGTPHYISPEAAEGRAVDARSDVYSLGITFWHALMGRKPYEGASALAVLVKQIDEPVPRLPDDVPKALTVLVARMMAKRPEQRPVSAGEVAGELRRFLKE